MYDIHSEAKMLFLVSANFFQLGDAKSSPDSSDVHAKRTFWPLQTLLNCLLLHHSVYTVNSF